MEAEFEFVENESGLKYRTIKRGAGEIAESGDKVLIFESTSYRDGTGLYSNEHTTNSIKVKLGANVLTIGVEEGLHECVQGNSRANRTSLFGEKRVLSRQCFA